MKLSDRRMLIFDGYHDLISMMLININDAEIAI